VSKQNVTLPIGASAKLHVSDSVRLSILEAAATAMTPQAAGKILNEKAHSSYRHLRDSDGFACGNAAADRLRVTGSDAAAYPPMSEFLAKLGIKVMQAVFGGESLAASGCGGCGNAMSRGNVELEYLLDERIPFRSLPQVLQENFLRLESPWSSPARMVRRRLHRCWHGSSNRQD